MKLLNLSLLLLLLPLSASYVLPPAFRVHLRTSLRASDDDFVNEEADEGAQTWLDSIDSLIDPSTPMEDRPVLLQR